MPLPKPKKNEKKKDFIDRCMSNDVMKDEYKDNKQRLAVCYDLWEKDKKDENADVELRVLNFDDTEIRVDSDKPMLVGYAAKTNSWTDLGFFKERIKPGAFSDVLGDDVRCLKNHDPNLILGRTTNETLRLNENTVGLHFENDIPDTTTGRDVREEVRSKLITGCSFAFTIAEEKWNYFPEDKEKVPERTILKIKKLFDVGPVTYPAYPDTSVAARSLENVMAENQQQEMICKQCGISYKSRTKKHKYCSNICANRANDEQTEEKSEEQKEEITYVDDEKMKEVKRRLRKSEFDFNYNKMEIERMKSAED